MASFSVVNNVAAANAQANLVQTNMGLRTALTRLSSGLRINNSGDDAAGLAVANSYRSKVAVLNQGIRNANDGLSTLQIKDGALNNISNLLDRLSTLATQVGLVLVHRRPHQAEHRVQVGARPKSTVKPTSPASPPPCAASRSSSATTAPTASSAAPSPRRTPPRGLGVAGAHDRHRVQRGRRGRHHRQRRSARSAPRRATSVRSRTGCSSPSAWRSRSRSTTQAADSRIRDANIAEESANMTKFNILTQSGIAALSQANQSSQSVLSLLR